MSICTLTEAAKTQINTICKENDCFAVTLNLKGGGCAGFEYEWGTISSPDEIQKNDVHIQTGDDGNFVIGAHSLMFLVGTEIDYKKDIIGAMFEINNPNAQSSCGCGVSVNFDMNKLPDLASPAA
jgi:iron-sulfur cluster assembly accessory protein